MKVFSNKLVVKVAVNHVIGAPIKRDPIKAPPEFFPEDKNFFRMKKDRRSTMWVCFGCGSSVNKKNQRNVRRHKQKCQRFREIKEASEGLLALNEERIRRGFDQERDSTIEKESLNQEKKNGRSECHYSDKKKNNGTTWFHQ